MLLTEHSSYIALPFRPIVFVVNYIIDL